MDAESHLESCMATLAISYLGASLMMAAILISLLLVGQAPADAAINPQDTAFEPLTDPAWKPLGQDIWFAPESKQLVLGTRVCLREGYLEHLLCSRNSKEHESILATAAAPRLIHAGLLLTGAEVGQTVDFVPEFRPPSGSPIAIEARWLDADGKLQSIDARQWVRDGEKNSTLAPNWVFAGSSLYPHPQTGEMTYAAESGDLITVANFMSAILDVPFASTADDSARSYMAYTERIPPIGTPVALVLSLAPPASPASPTPPDAHDAHASPSP